MAAEGDEEGNAALQVIVLGSGGGPQEDNTTALLVRSTASGWKRGSVLAVDAGTHLAAIIRILEACPQINDTNRRPLTLSSGPFAGFDLPHASASANAAHITTTLVDTYLITHPHLDHISGFVVNTVIPNSRPKRLAGLPSTIEAFKTHVFNNVIWPNLSDENNGAGLVTYMRLVEGGSPAFGDGDTKGYFEICEGLGVKIWGVSHGHCIENHNHRGSNSSLDNGLDSQRSNAMPRSSTARKSSPLARSARQHSTEMLRSDSLQRMCVVESSAYFIRDILTGREVLIFGDVEPDCISLSPRNLKIWIEAAPKIVSGRLRGVFIECSFDDAQSEDTLFGHLAPRYLINELRALAEEVEKVKGKGGGVEKLEAEMQKSQERESKKRKRTGTLRSSATSTITPRRKSPRSNTRHSPPVSPTSTCHSPPTSRPRSGKYSDGVAKSKGKNDLKTEEAVETTISVRRWAECDSPLRGLKVVIIHVKEKLEDGPDQGGVILNQLLKHEENLGLGCEFSVSGRGMSVWL